MQHLANGFHHGCAGTVAVDAHRLHSSHGMHRSGKENRVAGMLDSSGFHEGSADLKRTVGGRK